MLTGPPPKFHGTRDNLLSHTVNRKDPNWQNWLASPASGSPLWP